MIVLTAIFYIVLIAVSVALIDWRYPRCSIKRLVYATSLPVPTILLISGAYMFISFDRPRPPGEIDAGGYIFLFTVLVPIGGAIIALLLGMCTAELVLKYLRPKR